MASFASGNIFLEGDGSISVKWGYRGTAVPSSLSLWEVSADIWLQVIISCLSKRYETFYFPYG